LERGCERIENWKVGEGIYRRGWHVGKPILLPVARRSDVAALSHLTRPNLARVNYGSVYNIAQYVKHLCRILAWLRWTGKGSKLLVRMYTHQNPMT